MSVETETVLDRRRLRRTIAFWRVAALFVAILAIGVAMLASGQYDKLLGKKQIARVSITGTILEDREQLKVLRKIAEADHVAALIVHVNSPGGSTTGGEALFAAVREVAEKKPVVGQFGTVAASAGYIVGLATDHIVSRGNTITGSIGVLIQWPEVSELLGKIGVTMNEVKSGGLKAEPSPFKPADPEALKVTAEMINDGFRWFVSLVEARRGVKAEDIPGLMQGRIFSGRQAHELKLVDEIGGEDEAVRWLEEKRGVAKGLEIIEWKRSSTDSWGLGAVMSGLANSLGLRTSFSTLALDGLVSVWHPSEN